jgi:hypothetical protein
LVGKAKKKKKKYQLWFLSLGDPKEKSGATGNKKLFVNFIF